ncbi:AraC family ligand binding domain-containing protein [Nostoc sphaeroides CHAB 2801]|uniref:cupin domain-containing protein n=1 Tax=Nostoc sphaeroides TaxID=446679 RepID=UPI000E505F5F|nr:AraC family ligand binding domain-containing protein [Nostoc sphaeroides]MCC5631854.1 AraC family ligand binding domain-containing protein [Nostoc sphaeroides CHAB 2801]
MRHLTETLLQKQAQNICLESELFSIPMEDCQKFYCQRFLEATKLDYTMAVHPSSAYWVINSIKVNESEKDTHFLFVSEGEVTLNSNNGEFLLRKNCFAAVPGNFSLDGTAQVLVATRLNYTGLFTIGGPIEPLGRLNYIDGCSSTVLINPLKRGEPCLNFLYVPPGVSQTPHTHPSLRIGLVAAGSGTCQVDEGTFKMEPGTVFCLPENKLHSFSAIDDSLRIIIYHPDSDVGPTDDSHTMLNNTFVGEKSAKVLDAIRTK